MIASALALGVLAACSSSHQPTPPSASPTVSGLSSVRTDAVPTIAPKTAAPSEVGTGSNTAFDDTAHGCGIDTQPVVRLTVNPDGVQPAGGCIRLRPGQRLLVVNNTNGFGQLGETITVQFKGLPTLTIRRGASADYPEPVSAYLAPGWHFGTCSSEPGSNVAIWIYA